MDGDEGRDPEALEVGLPEIVPGALGGDHDDIDVGRRDDLPEVDVEAM